MDAPRHVLSVDRFNAEFIERIFTRAARLDNRLDDERRHRRPGNLLTGHILYRLFYEPSTRTYESFGFAAKRLGMDVLGTQSVEFSSVSKGETLADTIRTICQYGPSIIVLRSREVGQAATAATYSDVPVINAGDGAGEHPTQALLDLYTIRAEIGRTDNLNVVIGGDLAHGRTVRSLVKLLMRYRGNAFTFVSPPELSIPADLRAALEQKNTSFCEMEATDMDDPLHYADVVYWTRTQRERLDPELLARYGSDDAGAYRLGAREVALMPAHARILHPLPRVGEIMFEIDDDPRAAYFRQMHYGLVVRMALIEWALDRLD